MYIVVADMRAAEKLLVEERLKVDSGAVCRAKISLQKHISFKDKSVGVAVRFDAPAAGFNNVEIRVKSQTIDDVCQNIVASCAALGIRDMYAELYFYCGEAAELVFYKHSLVILRKAVLKLHLLNADRHGHTLQGYLLLDRRELGYESYPRKPLLFRKPSGYLGGQDAYFAHLITSLSDRRTFKLCGLLVLM